MRGIQTRSSVLRGFGQQLCQKRGLMQMVEKSQDVELNGFKITAIDADANKGQLPTAKLQERDAHITSASPVLFLHGLLGQGRMWRSFALNDPISHDRDVLLIDLRNHGESDHHKSMTYNEMAHDVMRFADSRALEKVTLIGHNIGGKTAMAIATLFPDRVSGLISLDTAPKASSDERKQSARDHISQIRALDIQGKTRKGAIDLINEKYSDKGMANLITNNLAYSEEDNHKTVKWTVNLDAIIDNIDNLTGYSFSEEELPKYMGPTFFLNGTLSVKYPDEVYLSEFPNAKVVGIEGAGHYIHMDRGQTTSQLIGAALHEIEQKL